MQAQEILLRCLLFISICSLLYLSFLYLYPVGYFVLEPTNEIKWIESNHSKSGVGVYIINLDASVDRYDYVCKSASPLNLPLHRISAIDSSSLSQKAINDLVDVKTLSCFCSRNRTGAIGCSLSHIKAWKAFLESNFAYALILEDDVSFDPVKLRDVIEQLTKLSEYWDINTFDILRQSSSVTIKTLQNDQQLVIYLSQPLNASAYIINRKAAQRFLEKALPLKMPVDHYFSRGWEFGLKFTGIENPRLVQQTYGYSQIAHTNRLFNNGADTVSFPTDLSYYQLKLMARLQSRLMRFLYNFGYYLEILEEDLEN